LIRRLSDAYMDLKIFLESLFGRPVDLVLADAISEASRADSGDTVHAPDYESYLEDIRDSIDQVKRYTAGLTRELWKMTIRLSMRRP